MKPTFKREKWSVEVHGAAVLETVLLSDPKRCGEIVLEYAAMVRKGWELKENEPVVIQLMIGDPW